MDELLIKKIGAFGEIAEIKRIYSVIESSLLQKNPACLVLASGAKGEGKTTMTAALSAFAANQGNKQVLAMDLNWYQPGLHNFFGLDLSFDMETLKQTDGIKSLTKPSGLEGLDVLTAVKPSKNDEVFTGEINALVADTIRKARKEYGFIVVDTSPMFPPNRHMIDPAIISKSADGVALVTLANVTPREHLKRATISLAMVNANVIGVIVNQWKNPISV